MRSSLHKLTARARVTSSLNGPRFPYSTSTSLQMPESKNWADPVARQYKFWNREEDAGKSGRYSFLLEMSPESIAKEAKIMSLSQLSDPANEKLHQGALPLGSSLLGVGTTVQELQDDLQQRGKDKLLPNVLFVSPSCPRAATVLPMVLAAYPSIEWVHCRSAGIDFIESDQFAEVTSARNLQVTNAKVCDIAMACFRFDPMLSSSFSPPQHMVTPFVMSDLSEQGQFSSSLAEYALMACSYFAKDLPRLMRQKGERRWINYDIEEL